MEPELPPPFVAAPPPPQASCWSAVVMKSPSEVPRDAAARRLVEKCKSSEGLSVAVLDASAIIQGERLSGCAEKFVSVSEVLEEVRDSTSRYRLSILPFHIETLDPSPKSIKKVIKFARDTGDLQTLSDVDLKLIALTHTLEGQIHGTIHLRDRPPPLRTVNVKGLHEADMPGWGSNVTNLKEWEAIDEADGGLNHASRILPLNDRRNKVISTSVYTHCYEKQEDAKQISGVKKSFFPPRKEIKIEGREMVTNGIDASLGTDVEKADEWLPFVSRSTHRRYLRRKARRELENPVEITVQSGEVAAIIEDDDVLSDGKSGYDDSVSSEVLLEKRCQEEQTMHEKLKTDDSEANQMCDSIANMKLDFDESVPLQEERIMSISDLGDAESAFVEVEVDTCIEGLDALEISNSSCESDDLSLVDDTRDQSSMSHSSSESTVACVTSDFAMQNVILQMGLRLWAPSGIQIRRLHRWVLRCHACNNVTQEIGRLFCPKCGNGGTLRKVSVTVAEDGLIFAMHRPRVVLRGTKFSLPLPQGGRDAITKNPILREDQLPQKLLHPRLKKKSSGEEDEFFFGGSSSNRRTPHKPPVGKTVSMFYGRRNPNDNHYTRCKR